MSANELAPAKQFLYEKLTGNATITAAIGSRVYDRQAPQGAEYPLIVFDYQSDYTAEGHNATRVLVHLRFLVRAIGEGLDDTDAAALADAIDAALHQVDDTVDGYYQFWHRLGVHDWTHSVAGMPYHELGGLYEGQLHAS
jgi:hypothetical protein